MSNFISDTINKLVDNFSTPETEETKSDPIEQIEEEAEQIEETEQIEEQTVTIESLQTELVEIKTLLNRVFEALSSPLADEVPQSPTIPKSKLSKAERILKK